MPRLQPESWIDWSKPYTIEALSHPWYPKSSEQARALVFEEADAVLCTLVVSQDPGQSVLVMPQVALGKPGSGERLLSEVLERWRVRGQQVDGRIEKLPEPITMTEPVVVVGLRPDDDFRWRHCEHFYHIPLGDLLNLGFTRLATLESKREVFWLPLSKRDEVFSQYVKWLLASSTSPYDGDNMAAQSHHAQCLRRAQRAWVFEQTPEVLAEVVHHLSAVGSPTRAYSVLRAAEDYFGVDFIRKMEAADLKREFR